MNNMNEDKKENSLLNDLIEKKCDKLIEKWFSKLIKQLSKWFDKLIKKVEYKEFCKNYYGYGNLKKIINYQMFKIEEIRITVHSVNGKFNKGIFKLYIIKNDSSNPNLNFKLNTIPIVVDNNIKQIRYTPNIKCNGQYFMLKGIKLKNIMYNIDIIGYEIIKLK